jgi:hypothetical protein
MATVYPASFFNSCQRLTHITAMQSSSEEPVQRLALRVRSLRQNFGSAVLGQAQLAALAGIPVRHLRDLESTRSIPLALRAYICCVPRPMSAA